MGRSAIAAAIVVLAVAPAAADIDNDKADKLFAEAVAMRATNPTGACAKFEEALGFNPQAISTRLNVALCDERLGRIASAVEKFTEVADRAREQNLGEYRRVAEERLAALVPELPKITITFADQAPETKLLIDDQVIPIDKPIVDRPIDPGTRVIVVTAPGRVAYRTTLTIEKRGRPKLEIPQARDRDGSRRTIGKITVAAGAATAVTGIVIGLVARSRYNGATERCMVIDGMEKCPAADAATIDSARTLGNVSTAVTIVGLGAAAIGGVLWWRSPRAGREQRGVSYLGPVAGPDGAAVVAAGRF